MIKKGKDILNPDHNDVSEFVFECSIHSNSRGVIVDNLPTTKQMRLFGFEPHQTELSQFVPDELVDITEVYERKSCGDAVISRHSIISFSIIQKEQIFEAII